MFYILTYTVNGDATTRIEKEEKKVFSTVIERLDSLMDGYDIITIRDRSEMRGLLIRGKKYYFRSPDLAITA